MSTILGFLSFLKSFPERLTSKGIFFICLATIQLQYREFVSHIPTIMSVFQTCSFNVIFLTLCFLLVIDSFSTKSI